MGPDPSWVHPPPFEFIMILILADTCFFFGSLLRGSRFPYGFTLHPAVYHLSFLTKSLCFLRYSRWVQFPDRVHPPPSLQSHCAYCNIAGGFSSLVGPTLHLPSLASLGLGSYCVPLSQSEQPDSSDLMVSLGFPAICQFYLCGFIRFELLPIF